MRRRRRPPRLRHAQQRRGDHLGHHEAELSTITGGSATTPGWKRGPLPSAYSATDNVGIERGASTADVGSARPIVERAMQPDAAGAMSEQKRQLRQSRRARSAADLRSFLTSDGSARGTPRSQTVRLNVDNEPPGPPLELNVAGGSSWRQQNSFAVSWRNPSQTGTRADRGGAVRRLPGDCGTERLDARAHSAARQSRTRQRSLRLTVPAAGEWNGRVWLVDAAGNESRANAQSVRLRLDDSPPERRGSARSIPATPRGSMSSRPTAISPLSRAEVEIQRHGRARLAAARDDADRRPDSSLALTTSISRTALRPSRARRSTARATSDRRRSRRPAAAPRRTVPARIDTRLVAGQLKLVRATGSRGRKPRTRRIIVVRPTVDFGRTIPIRGRLTTPGGNPVANASIEVWEQISLRRAPRRVASQ